MRRGRDPLATHNERMKLLAGWFNAISLGFLGFALLRPLVEGTARLDATLVLWVGVGLAMHASAHYVLRYIETERPDDDA